METIRGSAFTEPFPHLIFSNFYNEEELNLIWEELNFYTKPDKLFEAKDFGGVVDWTNSHAIQLDNLYVGKFRSISNILTVNRKLFDPDILKSFAKIHECCEGCVIANTDITKVRYYHDKEYYKPHTDWFQPHSEEYETNALSWGQRTWTVQIALNEPSSGGEISFPELEGFKPFILPMGGLIAWNNISKEGEVQELAVYEHKPVLGGEKCILTKHFRMKNVIE